MKTNRTLLIVTAALFLATSFVNAQVLITEVYPDPATSENGGEAIELFNTADDAIDISGWTLRTKSAAVDATLPEGASINAGSHYLIADTGWNESRDDAAWPQADYEEAITLTNTDGFVALIDAAGLTRDLVGWGSAAPEFEGVQAPNPAEGKSLQRIFNGNGYDDSGNNANDFSISIPTFTAAGFDSFEHSILWLILNLSAPQTLIHSIYMGVDDFPDEGTQITPLPGRTRTITAYALVQNPENSTIAFIFGDQLQEVSPSETYANGSALFAANFSVPFDSPPGEMLVQASLDGVEWFSTSVFIQSVRAIALNESEARIQGEQGTVDIGIRNIGNVPLNLRLQASTFTGSNGTIGFEHLGYEVNGPTGNTFEGTFAVEGNEVGIGIPAAEWASMRLNVLAQENLPRGVYSGTIEVIGTA